MQCKNLIFKEETIMYKESNYSDDLMKLTSEIIEGLNKVYNKSNFGNSVLLKMKLKSTISELPKEVAKILENGGNKNIQNIEKLKKIILLHQFLSEFKEEMKVINALKIHSTDEIIKKIDEIKTLSNKVLSIRNNLIN